MGTTSRLERRDSETELHNLVGCVPRGDPRGMTRYQATVNEWAVPNLNWRIQANALIHTVEGQIAGSGRIVGHSEVTPFWSYFLVAGQPLLLKR